jgi:creatinine amidohydrolase
VTRSGGGPAGPASRADRAWVELAGVELAATAWPRVPVRPLVLLPLGSTEQHGPHLACSTDTVIADAVARAVAAELGAGTGAAGSAPARPSVVVAPALAYGSSGEHQDFPGTVSMGSAALRVVLVELVRSLATWAGRVVVVNGHGGNVVTLARGIGQLVQEGHDVGWVPCAVPAGVPAGVPGDAHAGRTETSLMLHLAPELVDLAAAVPGATAPLADLLPALAAGGLQGVSANGVLGDPTGASADEGAQLLAAMTGLAARRVRSGQRDTSGCLVLPADGSV